MAERAEATAAAAAEAAGHMHEHALRAVAEMMMIGHRITP
jgi:hypothetical protein